MDLESVTTKMEEFIKDIGRTEKLQVKELIVGLIKLDIQVFLLKIELLVKVY